MDDPLFPSLLGRRGPSLASVIPARAPPTPAWRSRGGGFSSLWNFEKRQRAHARARARRVLVGVPTHQGRAHRRAGPGEGSLREYGGGLRGAGRRARGRLTPAHIEAAPLRGENPVANEGVVNS